VDQTVVLGESFPDPHFECEIPFPRAEPGRIVDVIESAGDVT
jgi:hypothetical protein